MKQLIAVFISVLLCVQAQASRAFSGTTNKVTVNGNSAVNIFSGPLTLSFWVYPTSTSRGYPVGKWVDGSGGVNQQYITTINDAAPGANLFGTELGAFNTITGWYIGCGTVTTGHWYRITARLDTAGILQGSPAYFFNVGGFITASCFGGATGGERRSSSTSNLLLGCGHGTQTTNCLEGNLCDVAIWNAVLSNAEVAALANGVSAGKIRRTSQVFYMPLFGETSPEGEFSGNALTGTLTGTSQGAGCPVGKTF